MWIIFILLSKHLSYHIDFITNVSNSGHGPTRPIRGNVITDVIVTSIKCLPLLDLTEEFASGEECSCPVPYVVTQFVPFVSHAQYPSNFYSRKLTQYFLGDSGVDLSPFFE